MAMGRLDGRVAIVTGGARGIGLAQVRALVAEGARVVAADILDESADDLVRELGEQVRYAHLDVRDEEQWRQVVRCAEETYGPVSVLVNNAGVVEFATIEEQEPEAFRRTIDINLFGAWLGMHVAIPSLRRAGGGVIVNISSTAGLIGMPSLGAYVASKWALRGLTKTAAIELGKAGIRVHSVHPGPIRTPMTAEMDESLAEHQPIARFGDPDEVARLTLYLVTDATYCTGGEFVIDGGETAGAFAAAPQ